MSEKKEEKTTNQSEKIKNETFKVANEMKESIKNVNLKDETIKTKGFITEIFKDPIGKIKEIADQDTKYFKTAMFILLIWTIAVFITSSYSTIYNWGIIRVFSNSLNVLKEILVPALGILIFSVIILIFNNKKKITNIISVVTLSRLPLAISSIVSILTLVSRDFIRVNVAFYQLCSVITIILSYFGFKALFNDEKDSKFIKKFILIEIIYYIVAFILVFLNINIY